MESLKKYWIWGIFISIISIFAMSHNANAINFNYEYYDIYWYANRPGIDCGTVNDVYSVFNTSYCQPSGISTGIYNLKYLYTNFKPLLKNGDLIDFYVYIGTKDNSNISGGVIGMLNYNAADSNITTLKVEEIDDFSSFNWGVSTNAYSGIDYINDFWSLDKFFKVYHVVQRVNSDGRYNLGFDTRNYNVVNLFNWFDTTGNNIRSTIFNVVVYRPSESRENKEVEEKTQEAVDESENAGNSSTQDAQTGTTGLLNAITGAVSVISSASPTNCKINGNMGNLDMGQLDLCANPAPAFIQTIGSLILILMCVPLAISLFNRFIAIFRSFQS